jgi:S-methylmethionine-dependent homocysteine/selenocysteine methylase
MLAVSMSVMSSPKTCSWLTCSQLRPTNVPAGADVLTVNNFACTEWSLARIGQADRQLELVTAAARLARRAADDAAAAGRSVLVAGSLPPLRESYRAAAGLADFELMQPQYNELAGALKPYCDLLLCETLASVAEGLAAATAASASGLPWWVSWTVEDRQDAPLLRSGEPLAAAVEAVAQLPGLAALLVNCSCPQAVGAALPVLAAAAPPGVLVGGYANGFKTTTSGGAAAGAVTGRRAGHDFSFMWSFTSTACCQPPSPPPPAPLVIGFRILSSPKTTPCSNCGHPVFPNPPQSLSVCRVAGGWQQLSPAPGFA